MATNPVQPPTVEAPSYKPGMASASSYQATPYKVEPQGLVQNHLKNVVQEDSPLMQQAARIATQKANARGLVNSSMAVGAAHDAVIGQAMPIPIRPMRRTQPATLTRMRRIKLHSPIKLPPMMR
mgnify:CR=1 FL=1